MLKNLGVWKNAWENVYENQAKGKVSNRANIGTKSQQRNLIAKQVVSLLCAVHRDFTKFVWRS